MSTALDAAIEIIRKRGATRTPQLAEELRIGETAVDAMLEPARTDGRLVSCSVEVGGRKLTEYRVSAAVLKAEVNPWVPLKPRPTHVAAARPRGETEPTSSSSRPGEPEAAQAATPQQPKGKAAMTVRDRIEAALKAHGPMDVKELRKHVNAEALAAVCSSICKRGIIRKLGGGAKSSIYGLPSQSLADRKGDDMLERGAELGGKSAAKKAVKGKAAKRGKRLKRTSRIPVKPTPSPAHWGVPKSRGAFRPALAADGAILFIGAKNGDFEVRPVDVRAILNLSRRLTPVELDATITFIERLDAAKVAA